MTDLRGIAKIISSPIKVNYSSFGTNTTYIAGTEAINPLGNITETPSGIDINSWWLSKVENVKYCEVEPVGKSANGGIEYLALLTSSIEDIDLYIDLLELLSVATEKDVINICIDSPGGYVCTGVIISTAILDCKAKVITRACGLCASAGSLIWSAGHICTVMPTATLMWHMSSHMDMGNSLDIKQNADLQVKYVKELLLNKSLEKGHITEEEITRICTDPNYVCWISAPEMLQRIQNNSINSNAILTPVNSAQTNNEEVPPVEGDIINE